MARGLVRRDNLVKDTLLGIAVAGGIMVLAALSPHFLSFVAKTYYKETDPKRIRLRALRLKDLERRKLISFKELGDARVRIELTKNGERLKREYDLDVMELKVPKKWDGFWRVVIYDIPLSQRKASNAFREKISQMGLFQLQRSVWVSPYECLEELEFLASVFEIDVDRCICYFKTKDIPREKELRRHFNL